jgi:hypothetical protein
MTTARTSPEHHTSAAGRPDLPTRYPAQASKLFEKDHAYAARLVQIATAIATVVRSTITMKSLDQHSSELREDDGITAGTARQPQEHRTGS